MAKANLTVSDLAVIRGERLLFEGLGFIVTNGEVLLLRGPNGAGKSSLLMALAGILRPETGKIAFTLDAEDEPRQDHLHLIGHQTAVKPRLTLSENLSFWQAICGAPGVAPAAALETVSLGGLDDIEAGHLSSGQTRRLALARLLVANRPLWLLDEPTASLDAEGDALVAGLIDAHLRAGGMVIAATHHDLAVQNPKTLTLGTAR